MRATWFVEKGILYKMYQTILVFFVTFVSQCLKATTLHMIELSPPSVSSPFILYIKTKPIWTVWQYWLQGYVLNYAVATAMETAAIMYHYLGLNCPPYTYTQQYTLVWNWV